MNDDQKKDQTEKMQEILDSVNKTVAEGKEDLRSAFLMLSTDKHTALVVGGNKDDMRRELAKALSYLIKEDPVIILSMAYAVQEYTESKKKPEKSSETEFDLSNYSEEAKTIVENFLSKMSKH